MTRSIIYINILCIVLLGSCSKWIDVKPSDRISEDVLFSSREGYLKALNGIYVEMADPSLYGQFLTAGAIDAMAQYYVLSNNANPYFYFGTYDYISATNKIGFEDVWQKSYAIIRNLNILLEKVGESPTAVLPEPYFSLVKGEALALRGYIHFDLLRLFGPAWSESEKDLPVLPYYINSSREIAPLYSSQEVMNRVLGDLQEALPLLQKVDPIRTSGVGNQNNANGDNSLNYRQYRLNYYALNTIMARAYLWQNDKVKAGTLAKATIDLVQGGQDVVFPFVTSAATTNIALPDRLFTSEVMFAMYSINRADVYNNLFSPAINPAVRLAPNAGNTDVMRVNAMYDSENDHRRRIWQPYALTGATMTTNQKFKDDVDGPGRYMIPMIRVSELYLIAAECSADLTEGLGYINTLRLHRNVFSVTAGSTAALRNIITSEYRREFVCEGQQFFYYKRLGFTDLPNHIGLTGTKPMPLTSYRVPLPDSETSLRQ